MQSKCHVMELYSTYKYELAMSLQCAYYKPVARNFYWGFFWTKCGPFWQNTGPFFYKTVNLLNEIEDIFSKIMAQNSGPF